MKKKLVIIGASGHGKVVADIALKNGYEISGFLDDNNLLKEICGFPVLGRVFENYKYKENHEFIIAIGNNIIREKIAQEYDVSWATLIHPTAVIGMDVQIGAGTVIMANAVLNPCTNIGQHCIINTGAIIEHDNKIKDFVHISPNAALAGTVEVGARSHIGAGACVKNNTMISDNVVVGVGAAVVKDIKEAGVYVGVPVRRIK